MSEAQSGDWPQVLEELDAMAAEFEQRGWRTISVAAGDSAAVTAETGRTDRHGYAYVIPGDEADAVADAFVTDGFPRTDVYRAGSSTHLYILTALRDPPTQTAILLAGALERQHLGPCRRAAMEAGKMYTHVFKVDGTRVGTFEHGDPTPFFPDDR